jgi:hypothetical protein
VIQAVSPVERVEDGDVDAVELVKGEVGALTCVASIWTQNNPSDKCKAGSGRICQG